MDKSEKNNSKSTSKNPSIKQEKRSLVRRFLNRFRRSNRQKIKRNERRSEKSESISLHVQEDHELLNYPASIGSSIDSAECSICFKIENEPFPKLSQKCSEHQRHNVCKQCLQFYFKQEIDEGRLPSCMYCSEVVDPSDVLQLLDGKYKDKYEEISVRRFLLSDPDVRFCPRPDCNFALIASEFASCPRIVCHHCQQEFCYHCRQEWHPNAPCDYGLFAQFLPYRTYSNASFSANALRAPNFLRLPLFTNSQPDIKPCPRCNSLISKMDDGSCNHMTCRCGAEFCWLCLKEISDLHYLSPSGCTFWGKQVWSKKKIIIWQIGTLVLAPPMIGLMAAVAIPATIVGVPIYVGTTVRSKLKKMDRLSKRKRRCLVGLASTLSFILSPVIAALTVAIGTPIVVLYVYGIIPITIMRTGGCGTRLRRDIPDNDQHVNLRNSSDSAAQSVSATSDKNDVEDGTKNDKKDAFSINDDLSVNGLGTIGSASAMPGLTGSGSGDVASTMALASFCSNSINEINHGDSTNASISSRGLVCRKGGPGGIPERSLTPVSRSETINEEK